MTRDEAGRPVTAAFCAAVEDTLAGLLRTRHDVVLLQGEAVLGLEAAVRGIGGPGRRVLNIVTGLDGLAANPAAPRESILSLLDWRDRWLRPGRSTLPTTPHRLETRALAAALDRLTAGGGQEAVVRRHQRARDATRAGLPALGFSLYVAADAEAASVATLALVPPAANPIEPARLLEAAAASSDAEGADDSRLIAGPAFGSPADRVIRLNHTGPSAALAPVLATLAYLGSALAAAGHDADVGAALTAATARWQAIS